jgi:hypothetical protein
MRMTASWLDPGCGICRIQGRGARSSRPPLGRLASDRLVLLAAGEWATGTYDAVDPDARRALPPCSGSVKEWPRNDLRVNDPSDGHP